MTKNEKQNIEALKIAFEVNEWEYFLLVLNEVRDRDKEIISMYRKKIFRFNYACSNAIKELELPNCNNEIVIDELKKALGR